MKNILKTFKPNITKRLISPIIKNQSNQVDALENEILKSFKHMNRVFNLKNPVPKKQESDTISLKDFESKYLKASDNEIDQIIQVIYKEEVKNIKEAKLFDKLVLFIRNCKKYNYPQYLTDVKYFKNKEIQNFMLNTNLLETLSNKKSKYSVANDFAIKFKVQSLYNLRKGEKGEKLDPVTEKDFEMLNYDYMNYLAETSRMEKIHKLEEVKQHNEKILEDYHSGNNAMETKEQLIVTDQSWQQHYIDYAMKIKKAERKESMGLSKFEEPFYEEALRQGESYVQAESQVNYSFIKKNKEREREQQKDKADDIEDQNEGTFGSDGTRFTNTSSTQLKYGFNEPYPYHGVEDYNDEEVMDDQKYFPGSKQSP